MDPAEAPSLRVEVVYSPRARHVETVALTLPGPCSLIQALRSSGLFERHPDLDPQDLRVGVWGRLRRLDDPVCDGDRMEVYRPLQVDPKEARRQRQRRQGATRGRTRG